jgi:beta-glucosidase
VHFTIDPRGLSEVDNAGHRAMRAGEYQIFVGGSSPETAADKEGVAARFTITGTKDLPE